MRYSRTNSLVSELYCPYQLLWPPVAPGRLLSEDTNDPYADQRTLIQTDHSLRLVHSMFILRQPEQRIFQVVEWGQVGCECILRLGKISKGIFVARGLRIVAYMQEL